MMASVHVVSLDLWSCVGETLEQSNVWNVSENTSCDTVVLHR